MDPDVAALGDPLPRARLRDVTGNHAPAGVGVAIDPDHLGAALAESSSKRPTDEAIRTGDAHTSHEPRLPTS